MDVLNRELIQSTAFSDVNRELLDRDETFGDDVDEKLVFEFSQPFFDKGELVDFGNQRTFLLRGDLVELRYKSHLGLDCSILL